MKNKYVLVMMIFVLMSCSGGSLSVSESFNKSVLVKMKNGESFEGVVIDINENQLLLLRANTKVMVKLNHQNIKDIQKAEKYYDLEGYIISENVYSKEKKSENSIIYSLIGVASGGLLGGLLSGSIGGTETSFISGLSIGALGGGYYGYTVGDETDTEKAVRQVLLKRKALKNIEKQMEGDGDGN